MRPTFPAFLIALAASTGFAQNDTIAAPPMEFGNYDPTLSAKEAVLANWELAASGIRAGEVLGRKIVTLADDGASYAYLVRQASFAQETMLARYHAAAWIYAGEPELARVDGATLRAIVASTSAECSTEGCEAESASIRSAFAAGAEQLGAAAVDARSEILERQGGVDAALMSEQFVMMADYLESGDWSRDLVLTDFGMDVDVVANRVVGTIALWRNVEPYVGLVNQDIDNAINASSEQLLRALRRETRGVDVLDPDGQVLAELKVRADELAAEFRRASALFAS
ncbi:MAG: hypothetical protein AAFR35_03825 [Pseudomonadota bacterium]